jgi:exonuclease SbcC
MIRKITIENFQSHALTEIEPAPGLTVLVGESDQGKSAVIRALRWLFLNQPRGAGFVRAGENSCRVAIEYDDGAQVSRVRTSDDNVYVVSLPGQEPEMFRGFGIDTPAEVKETTGVSEIDVSGESIVPNIAGQLEAPFLLGASGPMRAALIGMMARADVFDEALKAALADVSRIRREKQENDERIAELEEEISRFNDLPVLERAVEEASGLLSEVESDSRRKEFLKQAIEELNSLKYEIQNIEKIIAATKIIDATEILFDSLKVDLDRNSLLRTLSRHKLETSQALQEATSLLEATSGIGEAGALLETSAQEANKLSKLINTANAVKETAKIIAGAETVINATEEIGQAAELLLDLVMSKEQRKILVNLSAAMKNAQAELRNAEAMIEVCRGIPESVALLEECIGAFSKAITLKPFINQVANLKNEAQAQGQTAERARTALEKAAEEMKELMISLGQCPVCFNPLDKEAVEHAVENLVGC